LIPHPITNPRIEQTHPPPHPTLTTLPPSLSETIQSPKSSKTSLIDLTHLHETTTAKTQPKRKKTKRTLPTTQNASNEDSRREQTPMKSTEQRRAAQHSKKNPKDSEQP